MIKSVKKALLGTAVAMTFASSSAWATFYTDIASILTAGPPPAGTPTSSEDDVIEINFVTGAGETFTNNIQNNSPLAGGQVRVIGSNLLGNFNVTDGTSPAARYNGNALVYVFALTGSAVAGPDPVFTAATGRVALYTVPVDAGGSTAYNRFDPTTWGAVNGAQTLLNAPIALFDLAAPDSVAPGSGSTGFNLLASQVNVSAINTTTPSNTQGNFLFVPETAGSLTNTDGSSVVPVPGADWLTVTSPTGDPSKEGLINNVNEQIVLGGTGAPTLAAGLTALNTIGQVLGSFGALTTGGYFASDFCVASTCTPTQFADANTYALADSLLNSGDIQTSLGTISAPGTLTIPEPASLALMGIGLAGIGARMRKRA